MKRCWLSGCLVLAAGCKLLAGRDLQSRPQRLGAADSLKLVETLRRGLQHARLKLNSSVGRISVYSFVKLNDMAPSGEENFWRRTGYASRP